MKIARIDEMTKGWFIGNFEPILLKTNAVEVALKNIRKETMRKRIIIK